MSSQRDHESERGPRRPPLVYDSDNDRWIIERRGYGDKRAPALSADDIFVRFIAATFILLALYGAAMSVAVVFGDASLASKMISTFTSMFSAVVGLGSGYLLGKGTSNGRS